MENKELFETKVKKELKDIIKGVRVEKVTGINKDGKSYEFDRISLVLDDRGEELLIPLQFANFSDRNIVNQLLERFNR